MNYQKNYRETPEIICNYFRKHGICKIQGCQFLHRIDIVRPRTLRKIFHITQNDHYNEYELLKNPKSINNYNYSSIYIQNQKIQQQQQNQQIEQNVQNNNISIGLQQLYKMNFDHLKGFLEMIKINQISYFGLIFNFGLSFIKYDEQNGVDILSKIDFNLKEEIEDAFLQQYQNNNDYNIYYCLSIIIKEISLKGILIFPDFVNQSEKFFKLSDVSNTQIKFLRVNTLKEELTIFSSDGIILNYQKGFIRVFKLQNYPNQSTLKFYIHLQEVFLSVKQLSYIENDFSYIIATKQGNIYQYQAYSYTKIYSMNNQTIIDVCVDQQCKRIYILTQQVENNKKNYQIYYLNSSCNIEGPVFTTQVQFKIIENFQDFEQNNCLMICNSIGQIEILKEIIQNEQIKFLRQSKQLQNVGEIQKLFMCKLTNTNQVTEQIFLILRKIDEDKFGQQNFELYRLFQQF